MSTDFYIQTNGPYEQGGLPICKLLDAIDDIEGISFAYFDNNLSDFVITKSRNEIEGRIDTGSTILIVSQNDYLWVNQHQGLVTSFERRGRTDVAKILNTIEEYAGITLWTDSFDYARKTSLEHEQRWFAIGRYKEADHAMIEDPAAPLSGSL